MKIAHMADLHLDENNRFEETLGCFNRAVEDALKNNVELFVIAGDIFNGRSSPVERLRFAEQLDVMSYKAPVAIVSGNHDRSLELDLFDRISDKNDRVKVFKEPGEWIFKLDNLKEVLVCGLPWPEKRYLTTQMPGATMAQRNEAIRQELIKILQGFAAARCESIPSLLVGHVNMVGSRLSTGQTIIGGEIELSMQDLMAANADAYMLGHIHKHQDFLDDDMDVNIMAYAGSGSRRNFGETEDKGYILWTIDGHEATWEFRDVKAGELLTCELEWGVFDDNSHGWISTRVPAERPQAEVRVMYQVPEDMIGEVDEQKLKDQFKWALSLKIERNVVPKTRVRNEEISKAKTPGQKLQAYWKLDKKPDYKTFEGCFKKVELLETADHNQVIEEMKET